jgi:UDP-2,3-diacylglucosamine pyrophosphatase LpxH
LSPDEVYNFIDQYDFRTKCAWIFSFFSNLPQDQINIQYTQKLYNFLASQEDITSSPLRRINFLERYKSADPEVFMKLAGYW